MDLKLPAHVEGSWGATARGMLRTKSNARREPFCTRFSLGEKLNVIVHIDAQMALAFALLRLCDC